jgi:hypothetical protein
MTGILVSTVLSSLFFFTLYQVSPVICPRLISFVLQ